jgi:hypothetical protein
VALHTHSLTRSCRQWLTEATKTGSSFTLVKVRDGCIVSLEKLFGYDY